MLRLVPVCSSLADPIEVDRVVAEVVERLDAGRQDPAICTAPDPRDISPLAFVVITGGTERRVLELAERWDGPVVLLAHPARNSLPASLEILARLDQLGRRGRIILARDEAPERTALADCVAAMRARAALRGKRVGVVGDPSDWLVASTPGPALLRERWGLEVVEIAMDRFTAAIDALGEEEARAKAEGWEAGAVARLEPSGSDILAAARVAAGLRALVREHRLDACAVRCFDLVTGRRTTGCLGLSQLIDDGIMAGCEGDLPATLTMMWLQALTGERPFLANPQDIDVADNSLWLAHCTIARSLVRSYRLRSHFESSLGVGIEGEIEPGPATLARLGGPGLDRLFASDAGIIGSEALDTRCRTQVRVRLAEPVAPLLSRPLGNHHVLVRGHHARLLREYAALYLEAGA